ncbi:MAG: HepT-like ribonuclease domain-containing protein [Thermoplasmata archaeon]
MAARTYDEYTSDSGMKFLESRIAQEAVSRPLEIIGEAAGNVSAEQRSKHPEIPWRLLGASRLSRSTSTGESVLARSGREPRSGDRFGSPWQGCGPRNDLGAGLLRRNQAKGE